MNHTDPRTVFTKTMIKNALIDLLETKVISRITINELCKNAGVNRSTFYRYYMDIYALWEEIEDECYNALTNEIGDIDVSNTNEFIPKILSAIKENKVINTALLKNIDSSTMAEKIIRYHKEIFINFWKEVYPDLSERETEYLFSALLGSISYIIKKWIENDMKDSYEEISEVMKKIGFLGVFE